MTERESRVFGCSPIKLEASLSTGIPVGGVKDVQINGQTVVQEHIANILLGDGLEFVNHRLNVKGGAPQNIVVVVDAQGSGQLTSDELELLLRNPQNGLVYRGAIYYPATDDPNSTTIKYNAIDASVEENQLVVDKESGEYQLLTIADPRLQEHIDDNVRHITAAERQSWNSKMSVDLVSDPEYESSDGCYILRFSSS